MIERGLYVVTPDGQPSVSVLVRMVEQAIVGGAAMVQFRDKKSPTKKRLEAAQALQRVCEGAHVPLIINDDVALCQAVDAAGVHLGREDGSIQAARQTLGKDKIIGVSCYNELALAERARKMGADYVAFGRFFPSKTKPQTVFAPLSLLVQARKKTQLPIVVIGGVTLDNGRVLLEQGADILAVVQGVFGMPDIAKTASQFSQWFNKD